MNIYWKDLKLFLKNNFKKIIVRSIVFFVLFTGMMYFLKVITAKSNEEMHEEEEILSVFEDDSRPAYFKFYIKKPDGNTYTNGATIDSIFNLEKAYEYVLEETGIDLKEIKIELQPKDIDEEFKPVQVDIDSSSNIFTTIIDTGNNQDNMKVATSYYNYLFDDKIEILNNNSLYSIEEPELIRVYEEGDIEGNSVQEISSREVLVDAFIGLALGFIISVITLIIKELFSEKLNYTFSYNTGNPDNIMLYESREEQIEVLLQFIGSPFLKEKIIISEKKLNNNIRNLLELNGEITLGERKDQVMLLREYKSVSEVDLSNNIGEIFIIVSLTNTSRSWYNQQMELSNLRKTPIKIIQIRE